ncbi:MAG: hypothetical protein QM608_21280 [Caulobacter sp.]
MTLHQFAHAALSLVYASTAVVVSIEGHIVHALCAGCASMIYVAMAWGSSRNRKPSDD